MTESAHHQSEITQRISDYLPPRSLGHWLIGRPLQIADAPHQTIGKAVGLAVFSSDALSSTAYATQEILLVLALAGMAALHLAFAGTSCNVDLEWSSVDKGAQRDDVFHRNLSSLVRMERFLIHIGVSQAQRRKYLEFAEAHSEAPYMPPWCAEVTRRWREMLDRLAGAPDSVAATLDWAIKLRLFHRRGPELKGGFAFDCVPTRNYGANSAWRILSVLAFNLMRSFQAGTTAQPRARSRKRRTIYLFQSIQSLRYQWLNRAGRFLCPDGRPTLDLGVGPGVKQRFLLMSERLAKAA